MTPAADAPTLLREVPDEVWAEAARFGWRRAGWEAIGARCLRVILRRAPAATFAIALAPLDAAQPAFQRAAHAQVSYEGALAAAGSEERGIQLALVAFLLRAADRALGTPSAGDAPEASLTRGGVGSAAVGERAHAEPDVSPTACALATSALDVDARGQVRPCCLFARPLVDDDGRPFLVPRDPLARIWESRDRLAVRAALDAGVQLPECARCWDAERHGRRSKRQSRPFGAPEPARAGLRSLTVYPSNLCNLRCRTCDPESSSSVAAERRRLLRTDARMRVLTDELGAAPIGPPADAREDVVLRLGDGVDPWSWLRGELGELERIELVGGEPLLVDAHFELLAAAVAAGSAPRITLDYSTNGTQVPARARELWPFFREVRVKVSLDAVGARFEYLRNPARWRDVEANLGALAALAPNVRLHANATTSVFSVLYLDELVDFAVRARLPLTLNPLGDPAHFDPRALPPGAKRAVRARLARCEAPAPLAGALAAMLDQMDSEDWSARALPRFRLHVAVVDDARGERFAAVFPELAQLLDAEAP